VCVPKQADKYDKYYSVRYSRSNFAELFYYRKNLDFILLAAVATFMILISILSDTGFATWSIFTP